MSTRGTIGFRSNGKDKLMYNHSDSYPDGLGLSTLQYLRTADLGKLAKQAAKLEVVSRKVPPTPAQIAKAKRCKTLDLNVSERSTSDWYCVLRNAQGDLGLTLKVGMVEDSNSFITDSLFCEWAYIINFDTMKLEVYKGFNEGKLRGKKLVPSHTEGRYATVVSEKAKLKEIEEKLAQGLKGFDLSFYFGCYLVAEFDLTELPSDDLFLARVNEKCLELTGERA